MQNFDVDPRSEKSIKGLLVFVICMALVAIALIAGLIVNSQSSLYSFAAQEDLSDQNTESNEPTISSPTTQVIDLVSLMGLSQDEAIENIGHGATEQDQETLSSLGFSNEVVVILAEEQGDKYSGTPTVTLGLDSKGKVAAASYEAPTALLGFGDIAFAPAVTQFHIVEFVLAKVGLTEVEVGEVSLPEPSEYSTYESDRKTLQRENYSFTGQTTHDNQKYSWEVTLDYDYSVANTKSDLAYTIKRISVAIMKV